MLNSNACVEGAKSGITGIDASLENRIISEDGMKSNWANMDAAMKELFPAANLSIVCGRCCCMCCAAVKSDNTAI